MAIFKVGDRVRVPSWYGRGLEGTICDYEEGGSSIGIAFDNYSSERHNCSRKCRDGHGWYFNSKDLKLISRYTPKTQQELIIEKIKYLDYKFKMRHTVLKESEPDEYDEEEDDYDDSEDEEVAIHW